MERVKVKGVYYKRVRYSDIPGCDVKTDLVCPFCDLKAPECNTVCGEGCVLKKEEPKTKTKRVVVIWFGHVPECTDYVDIRARQHGNEWDKGRQIKACVIDRDRITIKERMDGEVVYSVSPPKPETVEDVLNDLYEFNGMNENEIDDFKGRIKAAQDREL